MVKICQRAAKLLQLSDELGTLRTCAWMKNPVLGNLIEQSMDEILHGENACSIREKLGEGDYSRCPKDNCPYLAMGTLDQHLVEIDEDNVVPEELWLGFEGKCNYKCTICSSFQHMEMGKAQDWTQNYDLIEERIKPILPHIKK